MLVNDIDSQVFILQYLIFHLKAKLSTNNSQYIEQEIYYYTLCRHIPRERTHIHPTHKFMYLIHCIFLSIRKYVVLYMCLFKPSTELYFFLTNNMYSIPYTTGTQQTTVMGIYISQRTCQSLVYFVLQCI